MRSVTFTFHGVGPVCRALDDGEESVWLEAAHFAEILDAIADLDNVRITFDDANASDAGIALPALRRRGLSATFFLVAARVDRQAFIDTAGVHALAAAGMGIGTHGLTHVDWRSLPTPELRRELTESQERLETLAQRRIDEASCPFGSYDRRVLATLRACGIRKTTPATGPQARVTAG